MFTEQDHIGTQHAAAPATGWQGGDFFQAKRLVTATFHAENARHAIVNVNDVA